MGEYDGVQIMVDTDGDRVGERVERYYFYSDASETDGTLMDVAHRGKGVVLTATRCTRPLATYRTGLGLTLRAAGTG